MKNNKQLQLTYLIFAISLISCTFEDDDEGSCETEEVCFDTPTGRSCIEQIVPGTCLDDVNTF